MGRLWTVAAAAVVAALAVSVSATPAAALWTSRGNGSGAARAGTLATPAPASAVCGTGAAVVVTWSAVALATSYLVERSVNAGAWTTVATSAGTSYTDSVATLAGVTVQWRTTARRTSWSSAPSSASNGRTVSSLGLCL